MTTQPAITVETIDLHTARNMLAANVKNRPLNERTVQRYVDDLLDGKWQFTGDAIRINCDGSLIDGQHRLAALIRAASAQPAISMHTVVIRNLPAETQDFMDIGKVRTCADQVAMRGMKNYPLIAAAGRLVIYYEMFQQTSEIDTGKVRHSVILEWVDANPEIEEFAARFTSTGTSNLHSTGALCAAAWIISHATEDEEAVSDFFAMLVNGVGLYDGSPVLALRNRLQQAASKNEAIRSPYALHLILRTWNAHRSGENWARFLVRGRNGQPIYASRVEH